MNRRKKYFQTIPVILLMMIGLLGCSDKDEVEMATVSQEQPQPQPDTTFQEEPQTADILNVEEAVVIDDKEEGFAESEEAVLYYLAGLRDNDFASMENTFLEKGSAQNISCQYAYLCGIDMIPEIASGGVVELKEKEDVEEFLHQLTEQIESVDFESMELLGFIAPYFLSDNYGSDVYQHNLTSIAQGHGGSELKNQVVAIQISGTKYILFLDTIKVDDRWYIFQLGGILSNLVGMEPDTMGTLRLDEEDEEIVDMILGNESLKMDLPETEDDSVTHRQIESEGFDTPQEAAAGYIEGLKDNDTEKMISTFCVESYAHNYNMQAYLEYLQSYFFMKQEVSIPPINDFTKDMLSCEREEQLKEDMLNQGKALYLYHCFFNDTPVDQNDDLWEWVDLSERVELDSIEILGFIPAEDFVKISDYKPVEQILNRRMGIYGADQVEECVAVFAYGGEKYCLFMEEVQYNGKWYNSQFSNNIAASLGIYTDYMGTAPMEMIGDLAEIEKYIVTWESN